jgi:hypothetical protein
MSTSHPDVRMCPHDTARRLGAAQLAVVCAALAIVATATPAAATTLIVLVSDRAIVIAADSLRTLAGGGAEAVCKIHDRDGVAYGFAGAVSAEGFDATAIAGRELAGPGDLARKARRIADALQAGLVEHFRARPIGGTRRELLEGHRGRPVTGFIAALVDGRPQGFLILVLADPAGDGVTLTTRVDPLDTRGPDRAIFLSSQHQEVIEQAGAASMSGQSRVTVPELIVSATTLVERDLELEQGRAPARRRSGPPVTVAVLEREGFRRPVPGVCAASPRRR